MPRHREHDEKSSTFTLVPIANLATLLVPMLVMGTQLVLTQRRDVGPAIPGENPGDAALVQIVPVIRVTAQGFRILGAEEVLAGPGGQPWLPCAGSVCTSAGSYDYGGLRRLVGHVKSAYPWAEEAIVVVEDDVGLDVLARAMDAVRTDGQRDLFPRVRLAQPE